MVAHVDLQIQVVMHIRDILAEQQVFIGNLFIGKLVQLSTLGTSQRYCAPCSCIMNIVFDNGHTQNTFEQIFGILKKLFNLAVNNQQLIQNMTEIIVYVSFKRQSL